MRSGIRSRSTPSASGARSAPRSVRPGPRRAAPRRRAGTPPGAHLLRRQAPVQEVAAVRPARRAHDHHAVALPAPAVGEHGAQQPLPQRRLGVVQQQPRAADPAQPAGRRGVRRLQVLAQRPEEEALRSAPAARRRPGSRRRGCAARAWAGRPRRDTRRRSAPVPPRPRGARRSKRASSSALLTAAEYGSSSCPDRVVSRFRMVPRSTPRQKSPAPRPREAPLLGQLLVPFDLRRDRLGGALRDAGRDHREAREEPREGERAARPLPGVQPPGGLDQGLGRGRAGARLRPRPVRVHRRAAVQMDHRHLGGETVPHRAQQPPLAHAGTAGEQHHGKVGAVQRLPAATRR